MTHTDTIPADHHAIARELLAEMDAHDGLAEVEIERFWLDNEKANADPFADDCPQVPMGLHGGMGECVFAELGIEEDWHRWKHDAAWRAELNKAYNDRSEKIVGRRLLNEKLPDPSRAWPPRKQLHDIFEAENRWHGESYWLQSSARTPDELAALLDRVEARLENLRDVLLPDDWAAHKARLTAMGVGHPRYRAQRGPVTFATSVYGTENLLFLIMDQPDLAKRFSDLILRAMLGIADVLDEEPGGDAPHGFAFMDDNCCLLTPDMYEQFALPITSTIFERFSPSAGDRRFQHSDSPMAHLLPLLGPLNYTAVNFGPTVLVEKIRQHMPRTAIRGVLAPFTFSRNEHENIVLEFLRDFDQARATGRGLVFTTAGSINNGSSLASLRLVMATIQRFGRYD